ncbi:hypothetical protein C8F01DRAFT_1260545 [Mycena amicta]|nr:hypothetical protein C8F01DRAFT_1260545 [Mycena amicta]
MSSRQPSIPSPGLVNTPTTPAARSKLLELLQKDYESHHCFFNDLGFHNHLPHHLVAAYDMGATPALLQAIYDDEAPTLRAINRQGADVDEGNWTERLGEHKAYGSYLAFFESKVAQHGAEKTIAEYVMSPKANGNGARMFGRFLGGALHPFLQVGFGIEFGQDNMIAAGLAMAALTSPTQSNFFLDETTGLPELVTAPVPGTTLLQLLQEVYDSEILKPVMPYNPDAMLSQRFTQLSSENPARSEELKKIYSKWSLDTTKPNDEEIKAKINECLLQATLLLVSTGKPNRTPRLDFFLMHLLTSALCLPSLLGALSDAAHKTMLLQGYARACAMYVLLRGRPRVDVKLVMGYTDEAQPPPPAGGSSWKGTLGHPKPLVANPWLAILQNALLHRDAHVVKSIRTLYYAATHSTSAASAEPLEGGELLDGLVFVRAAGVVSERLGWVAFGGKEGEWDRSALGWDEAWEDGKDATPGRCVDM